MTFTGLAAFLTGFSAGYLWAEPNYTIEYPQGYRKWTHVMSLCCSHSRTLTAKTLSRSA
jgi:hypothetical protein